MPRDEEDASFDWDEAWTGGGWTYDPDPDVVGEVEDLAPGRALDLGCGGGGTAIWLAGRGWTVTGVDISKVAIDGARAGSDLHGVAVDWVVADAATWAAAEPYDLVISNFALPPRPAREDVLATIANATAPGGTILVAEFHDSFAALPARDLVAVDELVGAFPGFEIEKAEVQLRTHHDHGVEGEHPEGEWPTAVLRARRPKRP